MAVAGEQPVGKNPHCENGGSKKHSAGPVPDLHRPEIGGAPPEHGDRDQHDRNYAALQRQGGQSYGSRYNQQDQKDGKRSNVRQRGTVHLEFRQSVLDLGCVRLGGIVFHGRL